MILRAGLLAILACGCSAVAAAGQRSTGSVRGLVVDARTGQPLQHARVLLDGQPGRVVTGQEGRFLLADVPAGPGVLQVSLVGYALARHDIEVPAGGSIEVAIPLAEGTGTHAEDVRVEGDLFPREAVGVPSQTIIGSAELQNLRGLLADDPMRAVQTLPGVAGSDDFRSDFSVRASDFRHIGVTLDGVPSTLLVHTVRNVQDGGSLAMINSDILDSVSLLAGSYPQRFGDRTGAHVDFRTREGTRDRTHVRLAVSAINASIVTEGPVGATPRGSWLFSLRKSYIDWLIRRIDPEVRGTFGFVDGQGKLVVDLARAHTLTANFVAGRSRYDERDEDPGPNSLEIGRHRSVLASVALRSSLGRGIVVTQRGYGVFNRFSNDNATSVALQEGTERDASYRADVSFAGWRAVSLDAGLHLQSLRVTGQETIYDGDGLALARESFESAGTRQGVFALARLQPHAALRITPGARVDRWTLTGEARVSPWLQGDLVLPGAFVVAAGAGVYRQAPDAWEVDGPRGNPLVGERARHVDVGIGQQVGAWRWQATAFDRREEDVIRQPGTESRLVNGRVVIGWDLMRYQNALDGKARGAEFSVQRRSANGLSGWVGYAFTDATYEDVWTGETFVADAEQRHSLNVYAHYRLSGRSSVSGRFRTATNTPLVGYYQEVDGRIFLSEERNELRLPVYSRLDLRGNRTFDVGRGRLTLHVEVVNVFNRRNLRGRDSPPVNRRTGEVRNATERLFPIVPSAGFTLEF
jgi:hypothetical protein